MASANLSCSICVDEFGGSEDLCSTVCGHIFHFSCLQQWQERSRTCPLCNRPNPQPHRLFLDLSGISKSESKQEADNEHKIVIKGIKQQLWSLPAASLVLDLAKTMGVFIQERDIKSVIKSGQNCYVTFFSVKHLNLFMENKNKLRGNKQTSGVKINEVLCREDEELFNYAHKLKQSGYNILFVKNKKIFAKINQRDAPLNIYSKQQVDLLCNDTASNGCSEKRKDTHATKIGPKQTTAQSDGSKRKALPSKKQSESSQQRNRGRSYYTATTSSNNQNQIIGYRSNRVQNPSTSLNARSVASNRNQISSSRLQTSPSRDLLNPSFTSQRQIIEATAPDISMINLMNNRFNYEVDDTERMFRLSLEQEEEDTNSTTYEDEFYGGTNYRQNSRSDWFTPPVPTNNHTVKKTIFSIFKKITEKFK